MTEETPATSTDAALGSEGDADQLPREDMLLERGVEDLLDEGYSPPERGRSTHYGETAWEEEHRETIDQRVRQEEPEVWEMPEEPSGDREEYRAGRLEADDDAVEAGVTDTFAHDVGVAGGAASAEEAAVHVIPDPDQQEPLYRADDEHE
ncbi:DUF5709 domain-containing protein [Cellulomonas sp. SG140]|uniref:DUF5709 domain-containing protein n=1 Tax=Cellulomonas sp. SG140 TaxID=2976536 RepID=UPI0021E710B2|nr:DUF5709 domain-containing protein [Cellulomonas sp. SG140]